MFKWQPYERRELQFRVGATWQQLCSLGLRLRRKRAGLDISLRYTRPRPVELVAEQIGSGAEEKEKEEEELLIGVSPHREMSDAALWLLWLPTVKK